MAAEADLEEIAKQLEAILERFTHDRSGIHIASDDERLFKRLTHEAKDIMDQMFGPLNSFSHALAMAANGSVQNYLGSPSYAGVSDTLASVEAAVNSIRRRTATPKKDGAILPAYVDGTRLAQIRSASRSHFDSTRLAQLCHELNVAHANDCFLTVAMLVRTIANHVPPAFGCKNFAEVANNLAADKSLKKSLVNLESSLKNIADYNLHQQIRQIESLPTATQVDFKQDLDRLLEEVVRRLNAP
ncbi:hypothetical protein [Hyphomonas jannaschiana]|uniref:Uncharacterized protein n=1 Tax=Hyphomonas jannaschiana VP2 TaxID=1280952 RepID=A0A059FDT2_9PROT|nr:hypothetical protein [Hyphomonas jannaschiana]KCZ88752.1 hypothetical protein HJA_10294 [Hyphomonas jannaschiana VP2]